MMEARRTSASTRWLVRLSLKTLRRIGYCQDRRASRGMQQGAVHRHAAHDPDLVILDEPFSGLDPINAQALKDTVVTSRTRKTVIFSTHLMDNAERLCDSFASLREGEGARRVRHRGEGEHGRETSPSRWRGTGCRASRRFSVITRS